MYDIVLVTMGKRVVAELEPRGTRRTIVEKIHTTRYHHRKHSCRWIFRMVNRAYYFTTFIAGITKYVYFVHLKYDVSLAIIK